MNIKQIKLQYAKQHIVIYYYIIYILLMFPEFKLRVYCYAKVTDVINVSDMNVVNDEISRLLMRSDGVNARF